MKIELLPPDPHQSGKYWVSNGAAPELAEWQSGPDCWYIMWTPRVGGQPVDIGKARPYRMSPYEMAACGYALVAAESAS